MNQLGVPDGVECLGEVKRDESDIGFRCQERGGLLEDGDEGSRLACLYSTSVAAWSETMLSTSRYKRRHNSS